MHANSLFESIISKPIIMKFILSAIITLILPFMGLAQSNPAFQEVFVFIYSDDFRNEIPLTIETDNDYSATRMINHDQNIYNFTFRKGASEFAVIKIGEKEPFEFDLTGQNFPVYIGVKSPNIFPEGVEIITDQDLYDFNRWANLTVEGTFPGKDLRVIGTAITFHRWKGPGNVLQVEFGSSPQSSLYKQKIRAMRSTLSFLKVGDQYFPLYVEDDSDNHLEMDFYLKGKTYILSPGDEEHPIQRYLNQKYHYSGLDEAEYDRFFQAFVNQHHPVFQGLENTGQNIRRYQSSGFTVVDNFSTANDLQGKIIREFQSDMRAYADGDPHKLEELDNLLETLTHLNEDAFTRAYFNAFHEKTDQEVQRSWLIWTESSNKVATIFFLCLGLFAITILGRIIRPRSALSKMLGVGEVLFQLSSWALLMVGFFHIYEQGFIYFGTIGNWGLFLLYIITFYSVAYFLVPHFITREKAAIQLVVPVSVPLFLIGYYILLNINPYAHYTYAFLGDYEGWLISPYDSTFSVWGKNPDAVTVFTAIFAVIYGTGRHWLVQRLPQISRKSEALTAELGALKAQISPHFFFNSLNTAYSFSLSEDSPKTAEAISRLSDLMRFVIYEGNKEFIELEKEVDYLSDYIELQKLRLDPEKHQVVFEVEGDSPGLSIPPLLLISIIENAFKHGISMNRESYVLIHLLVEGNELELTVENTIHKEREIAGIHPDQQGGIGLANTRQRLDLLYPDQYTWQIQETDDLYFSRIRIALHS